MNKKVCISGYYGFDNFGDELILSILVKNLKQMPNVSGITVFSSKPEKTAEKLEVNSVYSFNINSVLKEIKKSDILISGGGSLLQDKTSIKSLMYYLLLIFYAKILRKKVIIFAQGIGPIKCKLMNFITMVLLKHCDLITVRDDNSLNLLQKYNINAIKCSDPVWNIEIPDVNKTERIGIQLRTFPDLSDKFLDNLANCINKYYSDKEICLISLQNKLDIDVLKTFQEKLQKTNPNIKTKLIENTSEADVIKSIAQLSTLIAMRYHACLIGIKSGVKVLPVNYDIKVENLAKSFDMECIPLTGYTEKIFEKFVNKNIEYDNEKINTLKYNFEIIKKPMDL